MSKRKLDDKEARFLREKMDIEAAVALKSRADQYPPPPVPPDSKDIVAQHQYQRDCLEYAVGRADALGEEFESCTKCSTRRGCLIDITTFVGQARSLKCAACVRGKVKCSASPLALEARSQWLFNLARGSLVGPHGREWAFRVAERSRLEAAKKRAKVDADERRSASLEDTVRLYSVCSLVHSDDCSNSGKV